VTMKNAVDRYGADATRVALLLGAEGMDDPDWRDENATDIQGKLEGLSKFACDVFASDMDNQEGHLERWLLSKLQRRIETVTKSFDELKTRTALEMVLFEMWNDLRWYIQRKGKASGKTLANAVKTWLKLLAPFAPYTCEELWNQSGETGFISVAEWPRVDAGLVDVAAEEQENFIVDLIGDTLNILKATKIAPKRVCIYIAASWKLQVYLKILSEAVVGEVKINEIMKELSADAELKPRMREVAGLVPRLIKALMKLSAERKANVLKIGAVDEKAIIEEAVGFLRQRFNAEVSVYREDDSERYDPKGRAGMAMPGQPAIFIE
jgi:leucyl-tRNA synthetase